MTVIIDFPLKATPQAATVNIVSDPVLHELLRKAVVAHRAGEARTAGSLAHRHHLAVSVAVLDAIEIVMGVGGLARELGQHMDARITDVRKLARVARDFDGPRTA
ncbi:hypothetical protein Achl_4300 (plasmid) [Pseudarthrobacter chlorophenolicus A6]|uniref:Uncharacterized protein n=1 Tax=Pseudarthrobacter chlorophenolicus (strain ATCC 700700 / DSM 12829 / CIP 107037 / JCM 12360 / KCTC 9906 / NCIMB 13794 / A6) TaxID=452863 RepID=B8HIK4_PSECP|nr:hypothetical protein [Pseudarthrobacter chlorophenolicus]ACL42251.1 hypothetical protein Achl_4300 [Pseudarthrobacter chlorophenolicus A6]SDQ15489.1 hypothetical protein SAMN04489738_0358 [Pseudarthrobacter chlorophenolicus]